MPKLNVLLLVLPSLYRHVLVNHLNLKYIRCAVMTEWLTHLTKDLGGHPVRISPDPSYKRSTPGCYCLFGCFLACYCQRFEDKRTTRNSQIYCLH